MHLLRTTAGATPQQVADVVSGCEKAIQEIKRTAVVEVPERAANRAQARPSTDDDGLIRDAVARSAKERLPADQFARFARELDRRAEDRKRTAVNQLLAAIDRNLLLSHAQRIALRDDLLASWHNTWFESADTLFEENLLLPNLPDRYVLRSLTDAQRTFWRTSPKSVNTSAASCAAAFANLFSQNIVWEELEPKPILQAPPATAQDLAHGNSTPTLPAKHEQTTMNHIGMTFVLISPGEFNMGSPPNERQRQGEELLHHVRITAPFYIGETEVTCGQFRQFVHASGYQTEAETSREGGWGYDARQRKLVHTRDYNWKHTGFEQTDQHPVVNVSWNDAVKFCDWLTDTDPHRVCYGLPSEAEWEFACRGGSKTAHHAGDDLEALIRCGNVADATMQQELPDRVGLAGRDGFAFTAPVKRFQANALGLFDMHGNAWEWCADWHDVRYYLASPVDDPPGAAYGTKRVHRGGSWSTIAGCCRSAYRFSGTPDYLSLNLGFRVAWSPKAAQFDGSTNE